MLPFSSIWCSCVAVVFLAAQLVAAAQVSHPLTERQSTNRLAFCHFIIGIVGDRISAVDYDDDMKRAKLFGIDAFALNIGTDNYTDTQLGYAYESAANNDMKVFISFDFNFWNATSDAAAVGGKVKQYADLPAQLKVDNDRVFASSFVGDALDIPAMRAAAGVDVFWAPNIHPQWGTSLADVDAAFNWMAWDNNGNNRAPTADANITVGQGDQVYINALEGKPYMALPYSKNWVFPGDLLWYRRWNDILSLGPRFVEIITWNDYGESHYVGPLSSKHYDDGNSKWTNDMPHDGWLDMAKPFIAAYKAGATSVDSYITQDQLIYWYRPTLSSLDCDATDTTMLPANNDSGNYYMGRPNGWQTMSDSVFVVALLTEGSQIVINSGNNSQTFDAPVGASSWSVPMGVGQQQFSLTRDGTSILSGTSLKDISSTCICGIYNFNAYVDTVPAGFSGPLGPDGLASLTVGLRVSTCSATPSLGTAAVTVNQTVAASPPASSSSVDQAITSSVGVTTSGSAAALISTTTPSAATGTCQQPITASS